MKFTVIRTKVALISLLSGVVLCACGGGGDVAIPGSENLSREGPGTISIGEAITDIKIESTGTVAQTNVPVTFGQVFAEGHLPALGAAIAAKTSNNAVMPLQLDVKATHADGSVRHAVISGVIPTMAKSETQTITLVRSTPVSKSSPGSPASFTAQGLDAVVTIRDSGIDYSASLAALLNAGSHKSWLTGEVANEWLVTAPLKSAANATHPYVHARFAVRAYAGTAKAKIDVTLENTWIKPNPAPSNGGSAWSISEAPRTVTYDLSIAVPGATTFNQLAVVHYPQTRFKKQFWWGTAPSIHVKHNTAYLIASKAVPNYDQSLVPSTARISTNRINFLANNGPLKNGIAMASMASTGGRPDIGPMTGWDVLYLLSQDKDAKLVTMGQGDLSGSWGTHYRDINTDAPVTLARYPYIAILAPAGDSLNPSTGLQEKFPAAISDGNPNGPESGHHPDMFYLPYLVSGDHYYLEELQFWVYYCMFQNNPVYRGAGLGLVHPDQVRGQAWSLRTLSRAAYVTPDGHPQKAQLMKLLQNNLDYYIANYANNNSPDRALGIVFNTAFAYRDGAGAVVGLAPWQDDFFTTAIGMAVELGFTGFKPLLDYKAKFPVLRLASNDADFCYILAPSYSLNLRSSESGPNYTNIAQVYQNSISPAVRSTACGSAAMAAQLSTELGRTVTLGQLLPAGGEGGDGSTAALQPAVAYAKNSGIAGGAEAWRVFDNRVIKQDYTADPMFAILPRS